MGEIPGEIPLLEGVIVSTVCQIEKHTCVFRLTSFLARKTQRKKKGKERDGYLDLSIKQSKLLDLVASSLLTF